MDHTQPLTMGEAMVQGDEGVQVAELQRRLAHLGYYLGAVDGRYGETTETAVREFQRAYGQTEDGRIEFETWGALDNQARSAGYDSSAQQAQDGGYEQDAQQYQSIEPGQLSEDGQWRWDGTDWRAADEQAQDSTTQASQLSEDGQWRWDGSEWHAVEPTAETAGQAQETPAVSEYPDVKEGDSGEWVAYLDSMLRSKGF